MKIFGFKYQFVWGLIAGIILLFFIFYLRWEIDIYPDRDIPDPSSFREKSVSEWRGVIKKCIVKKPANGWSCGFCYQRKINYKINFPDNKERTFNDESFKILNVIKNKQITLYGYDNYENAGVDLSCPKDYSITKIRIKINFLEWLIINLAKIKLEIIELVKTPPGLAIKVNQKRVFGIEGVSLPIDFIYEGCDLWDQVLDNNGYNGGDDYVGRFYDDSEFINAYDCNIIDEGDNFYVTSNLDCKGDPDYPCGSSCSGKIDKRTGNITNLFCAVYD